MIPTLISVADSAEAVADEAAQEFATRARDTVEERGVFRVALAGGSTPAGLYRHLAVEPFVSVIPWSRVHVFWGDERCVSECDADRNDLAAREAFLSLVPIPPENVHPVPAASPDAADRYQETLQASFSIQPGELPRFDLVILGIGPDGHTASLFPGHPALEEKSRLVIRVSGAPKPPPERITLTLPVLNNAACVIVLATGTEKAEAVRKAVAGDGSVPAGRVKPPNGHLLFLLDSQAAALI